MSLLGQFFFKSSPEAMFIDLKKRGREGVKEEGGREGAGIEKHQYQRETSTSCLLCALLPGSNPQPRCVP